MTHSEFVPNQIWAYHKGRSEPALKVTVLERVVRGKQAHLKIRHLEAKLEGLEEWVIPGKLVCSWKEWPKWCATRSGKLPLMPTWKPASPLRVSWGRRLRWSSRAPGLLVDLAIAFAVAEPQTVNLYLDMGEEEYQARGFGYEGRFYHPRLLKSMPAWSIARHWSGIKTERDHILREQERLRGLVQEAIAQLLKAVLERQGKMLERKLLPT